MRCIPLALVVTSNAFAQPVPGTGGDPIRELMLQPSIVNAELPVLAIHGGNPDDTVVLFDGFELPWVFHADGVRSILPASSVGELELMPSAFGVEYGGGSSVLAISSEDALPHSFVELTAVDITARVLLARRDVDDDGYVRSKYGLRSSSHTVRFGWNHAYREHKQDLPISLGEVLVRQEWRIATPWWLAVSGVYASGESALMRAVVTATYKSPRWLVTLAASGLNVTGPITGKNSLDSRAEFVRKADAGAGLSKLEWRLGQQTSSTKHDHVDLPAFWRHDVGLWSSIAANVSANIRATAGVRVDNFDGDVATQPRGALLGQLYPTLTLALAAGAYRRPPEQPSEIGHDLNPERATHVAAAALFDDKHGLRINAVTYFIDRRRLVARDSAGELGNSGTGTSLGIDLFAQYRKGPWFTTLSTALTSSKRVDYYRGPEHPSDYEQPFRLDVIGGWQRERLVLSARVQLASGLPYTPYTGAIYDSDADTYEPLFVPPLSARAPFHHQIDLRVDWRVVARHRFTLDAFLDLHNAYRNRDAIGYRYDYDYSGRTAITALPLFPFVGLRAYL
jgi:hypothetical protein